MSECKNFGVDGADFGQPMPWIGYYIAAASFVCLLAMIADYISSLRLKQKWISSRYLSVNTISLTIFTIAIKLSTDLTTPMPRAIDQIAKLSTSSFICVVLSISIPSIGKMSNHQAFANLIALAILIITSVVNLCMQLATGLIFAFRIAHVMLISIMLLLLTLCGASAISLVSIKDYLQVIYEKQHFIALKEFESDETKTLTKKLLDYLTKFSIMAQSGCPVSVLTRSTAWRTVLGFFSLIIQLCLLMGLLAEYFVIDCQMASDYKQSIVLIVLTQATVTCLGIIPRTSKVCTAPKLRDSISWQVTRTISIRNYLIQGLTDMNEVQFFAHIHDRHSRKVLEAMKDAFFYIFMSIYGGVIFIAQVIYFTWTCCFRMVLLPVICCYRSLFSELNNDDATGLNSLQPYVLYIEGEEETVKEMLSLSHQTTQLYLRRGKKKQPNLLIDLLNKMHSPGFDGIFNFDSDQVPPLLDSQQPPSNWTLPIVTLTSIAIALPGIGRCSINKLLLSVSEGLIYVNQIEDCLNDRRDMIYVKKASKIVWKGVDLHRKWLDIDLAALALQRSNSREVLEFLTNSAKAKFLLSRESIVLKETSMQNASIWSTVEVAAHSMYRISKTLLLDYIGGGNDYQQSKWIFKKLSMTISDILGACLTNLKYLILKECAQSSIERRKDTAFDILDLFGRTEKIMEILEKRKIPELSSYQLPYIDEWRSSHVVANHLA